VTSATSVRRGLVVPSIAAACAFAVLVGLGTWQVQRKAWKEGLIATVSERFAAPPAALPPPAEWARLDPPTDEFRRVRFKGELLNDKEALVFTTGSSLHGGDAGPGYWVFTPARVLDRIVMVNRGFVAEDRKDPATRPQGQIVGPVEIVGVMRWPEQPGLFTPAGEPAKNLWFVRDSTAIAQAKGVTPAAPFYVEQESPPAPGGLPRAGALQPSFPNNHLGYAITWYGLALVLAGSFSVWFVGRLRGR
jgi:surfeit locus 1 family protein